MKKLITISALLCALLSTRAQYMSFFGDSTWEYHSVVVTQPPEDYLEFPPETPSPLGAYCQTVVHRHSKASYSSACVHTDPSGYMTLPPLDDNGWESYLILSEDTLNGRLYNWGYLICDMSLSEGDTFFYPAFFCDMAMLADSVRYIMGRKTIFLSLLNCQDDYFFGTVYADRHADYPFSIQFIEGIGPTCGLTPGQTIYQSSDPNKYAEPNLMPLLCLYKDDSLTYMADGRLGCYQACVGVPQYAQIIMNLYPNPATQYVVLDMSTGEEMNGWVAIMDMLGKQCHQQKAIGTSIRISVSDLPTGMYFLTYTDGKKKVTRKFLKK